MKYEYKYIEEKNHLLFIDQANALGQDGWDLVDVEYIQGDAFMIGIFKRQIVSA